ncbi:lipoprotein releasing system%2C transmembrane protein%2C LolC/E family [Streptococcus pneumoniae]|nr:lipoprotein releasing system%2C transmembrane protein%2C LolC/E family [Streptococcus pneumoniae]
MRLADSLWIEWKIALRFLLDNRMQTLLITFGIAVGSAVIVFITALITGLQANVIQRTLGTQAHIRILPPDEVNRTLPAADSWSLVLESPRAQRLRSIINWQDVRDVLDQDAQILAVSPVISGPAIARRGVARASVALLGIDPPRYQRIIPLADDLIAGRFLVGAGNAVIGKELARDLGLGIGDKLRLDAGEGREAVVDIAGIFELGVRELDARYVYQPVEIRRDDYAHCFWQQRSRSFTSRLGRQSMEIARFGVLQAHLPRQRAHAIEPVASSFGRRTRLLAAMASWNSASTRSSPRCFTWRSPAAALSQPKWVSIQARIFRLRP